MGGAQIVWGWSRRPLFNEDECFWLTFQAARVQLN
jgi:steroid 5-alpha reductase family enzyme